MTNFSELRVFLCTTPTSMRFSFDRLMGLAERVFNQDPLSGHLFLFLNRGRNRVVSGHSNRFSRTLGEGPQSIVVECACLLRPWCSITKFA